MFLRVFLFLMLFGSLLLGEDFALTKISEFSDKEVIAVVEERLKTFSDREKLALVEKTFQDGRGDLFLELMKIRELPTGQIFENAPSSHFKYQIALDVLRTEHLWSIPLVAGASGVGSLYQQSLTLCHTVINPFFQKEEIDWNGNLTRERRLDIAGKFENLLVEEEGFSPSNLGDQGFRRDTRNDREEQFTYSSNQKNENLKRTSETQKSTLFGWLYWILGAFIFGGCGLLVWNGRKGSSAR